MITFTLCLLALIVGYFTYGRLMERVFGPDDRKTPALTKADGVDYIPLPTWKIFMIQFLNIAGLGPIFGAIMGAKFGSSSYLWIVLGSIFAGAVHDYFAGMLSLRHEGESLPEIIGRYLGLTTKQIMRGFTVILMILVGSVFVAGPAGLLAKLTPESLDATFWIIVVFAYYILATLLPVDKIIGKIYPLFAIALLFMAVGILVMLSDNVREYCLWCNFRFPCYTKSFNGSLHDFGTSWASGVLRCNDNRRHRCTDLGCRRYLLFP